MLFPISGEKKYTVLLGNCKKGGEKGGIFVICNKNCLKATLSADFQSVTEYYKKYYRALLEKHLGHQKIMSIFQLFDCNLLKNNVLTSF